MNTWEFQHSLESLKDDGLINRDQPPLNKNKQSLPFQQFEN